MNIDYEKLREDLIDYYGTAMMVMPMAMMELSEVQRASNEKLIQLAINNGFDLSNYENQRRR